MTDYCRRYESIFSLKDIFAYISSETAKLDRRNLQELARLFDRDPEKGAKTNFWPTVLSVAPMAQC